MVIFPVATIHPIQCERDISAQENAHVPQTSCLQFVTDAFCSEFSG